MSRLVVVHHAHHADEGIYRIIVAEATEVTKQVAVPNPNYDSSAVLLAPGDPNYAAPVILEDHRVNGSHQVNGSSPEPEALVPIADPSVLEPTIMVDQTETVYENHMEVVWHAEDPKWAGRSLEDIATEQRQILKDHLAERAAELVARELAQEKATTDMGTGTEL